MTSLDHEQMVENLADSIDNSDQISSRNKELILDFKRDLALDGMSAAWQQNCLSRLKISTETAEFDLDRASEDDLKRLVEKLQQRDIAERTVIDYKKVIKRFYKWLNDGEHPEKVEWMNTSDVTEEEKLPENLLTEDDVKKLLDSAKSPRTKALIAILWETGARIGEIRDLTIGDLQDHDHGLQIVIQGKTGARRLPLISSVPHIRNWLNNHPSDDHDAPLWAKVRGEEAGEKVSYRYQRKSLRETGERAGIDKPANPHHFRHSRATYLASRFTEAQLCEWFGWVQGSDVPAKYVHLSGRDIDASYAELHGIEQTDEPDESQFSPIQCPRCEEENEPEAQFCQRCGQALDREAAMEIEEKEERVSDSLTQEDLMELAEALGKVDEDNIKKVVQALKT